MKHPLTEAGHRRGVQAVAESCLEGLRGVQEGVRRPPELDLLLYIDSHIS